MEETMQCGENKLQISNACLFNLKLLSTLVLTFCTQFQMNLMRNTPFSLPRAFEARHIGYIITLTHLDRKNRQTYIKHYPQKCLIGDDADAKERIEI